MFNFFKKETPIGIDISDYSIEILQLNKKKEVVTYGRKTLTKGIIHNGVIIRKEEFAQNLKELLKNIKTKKLGARENRFKAVLSIPESKVFIHRFDIPKDVPKGELRQAVFVEASKMIPIDPERLYWDYLILPTESHKDEYAFAQVLYVGALKEIIDDYAETLRLARVEPIAMDIESLSLGRALLPTGYLEKLRSKKRIPQTSSSMILDIGANTTIISIFDNNGFLNLSVSLPVAGEHFTAEIADALQLPYQDAEKLKKKFGCIKKKDNKILPILKKSLQYITDEINNAINYYESKNNRDVRNIVLAGGSALLPNIEEYLTLELDIKVNRGNPLDKIIVPERFKRDKKNPPIIFAGSIGSALRGVSSDPQRNGINLLHEANKESKTAITRTGGVLQNIRILRKPIFYTLVFISIGILGFVFYRVIFLFFVEKSSIETAPGSEFYLSTSTGLSQKEVIKYKTTEEQDSEPVVSRVSRVLIEDTPTGWLNVREGPGIEYPKITKVYPGGLLIFLEEKNNWYKIKVDEVTEGWVTSKYAVKQLLLDD